MAPRQRVRPAPRGPNHVVCDLCIRSRSRESFTKITRRPQCDDCRRTLRNRTRMIRALRATLEPKGISFTVRNRVRDVRLSERPDEGWINKKAVQLAAAGIVMVDARDGKPIIPEDPSVALSMMYRALIPLNPKTAAVSGRLGPLCKDRLHLLGLIKQFATHPDVPKCLSKNAEAVRDIALIWEGGYEAEAAVQRQLKRMEKKFYKVAYTKWSLKLMSKEEAEARLRAGILIGLLKWSPLHEIKPKKKQTTYKPIRRLSKMDAKLPRPKMPTPEAVVGWWVGRELQIRTRADRGIGVMPLYESDKDSAPIFNIENGHVVQSGTTTNPPAKKGKKPKVVGYTKSAVSYDGLTASGGDDDGVSTPIMSKVSADGDCGGQRRNGKPSSPEPAAEHATGLSTDLDLAFAALSSDDAAMVRDHLGKQVSLKSLAAARGITTTEARGRIKKAQAVLCSHLSSYEEH